MTAWSPGQYVKFEDERSRPAAELLARVPIEGPWGAKFAEAIAREEIPAAAAYYDLLKPLAAHVDIWTTIYNHPLANPAAIVDWVRGTGLRPYLARLTPGEERAYLADYE